MPEASFSHTHPVAAPQTEVWERLQDAETWKGFGRIERVWDERHEDGDLASFSWGATAAGQDWEGTARVTTSERPGRMTIELDSAEIGGEISVGLEGDEDRADLTIGLVARSKGFLSGMFWPVIKDALDRGLRRQLEEFAESFG